MELREYLSVRRAYNLVRQKTEAEKRLTFEEFAILCRLDMASEPVKTSEIASYQGALRPTMTHRTNHLATLGFIERGEGVNDRRNIECKISEEGREYVRALSQATYAQIPAGQPLARTPKDRLRRYVDAMGSVYCTAGQLILVTILANENERNTVTSLVDNLGFLQPTISMSIASLADKGLVVRAHTEGVGARSHDIKLTDEGRAEALTVADKIAAIVVHRKARS